MVPGKVTSTDIVKLTSAKTAQGSSIHIVMKDGKVKIDNATVIKADIECSNGVVHVIDWIILPE